MSQTAEIKAGDVQKLRQMTGAGLMDCKRALTETNGDFEKAVTLLRERGIAKSSKRADRTAGEGLVDFWISSDLKEGILFELNCETDFVARNDEFGALLKKYIELVKANPSWTSADLPKELAVELSAKIGEKIEARRFARFKSENGIVASYIHSNSKLGVLVQVNSKKAGAAGEAAKTVAKEITLQIAGANPTYVSRSEVPGDVVEKEKDILKKQMEGQNKPADILEKIAVGKLQQFYAAHCLLDQIYVRDESRKTTIQNLLDEAGEKEGGELTVARFAYFRVGAE